MTETEDPMPAGGPPAATATGGEALPGPTTGGQATGDPASGAATMADAPPAPPPRILSDAARRALAEAEERRRTAVPLALPPEFDGRGGPEPVRYGDWEVKGIVSDF